VSYPPPPAGLPVAACPAAPRIGRLGRLVVGLTGCVLLGLLATAARLTPDPQGIGTHRQLGLPACTIVAWYGVRCPSCGMTTAWAHVVRGQAVAALRASVGGSLLALTALAAGPWLVGSATCGRWLVTAPHEGLIVAVGLTIVVVTLVDWTLRLSFG